MENNEIDESSESSSSSFTPAVPPVLAVFGYSKDKLLFEQAMRSFRRLAEKGQICQIRLYDDANDPMYNDGEEPEDVVRIETTWDRGGFRRGGFNEETVRGILASLNDALSNTGADWVVKADCDAAINSLEFMADLMPNVYGEFGCEAAQGISMGVTHAFSAPCLHRMLELIDERMPLARLIVLDRPEAPSTSVLASMTGMKRELVKHDGTVGVGWRHSIPAFGVLDADKIKKFMSCVSVFFKPSIPAGTPPERESEIYRVALANMTAYTDELIVHGDEYAPKPPPRKWSRLSLKRALFSKGWWATAKGLMQAADAYDDFLMCDYVQEDDPAFIPLLDEMRRIYGPEIDEVLDALPLE